MSSAAGRIAIMGAGTWGTTLAWLYGTNGKKVSLWTREPQKAYLLNLKRRLELPLAITIPNEVEVSSNMAQAVDEASIIVFCCTSQAMREVARQVQSRVALQGKTATRGKELVLVSAVKGLELTTLYRMSQVLTDSIPGLPVCALSGPNLAAEILQGLPTASVIASERLETACFVQQNLSVSAFRLYTNQDLVGVELGGTLKNIIAIAAGCSDGLNLGANAKAALLTRGLAEMTRLAQCLGAKPLTMSGLAGMGDLFATCTSLLSRNYRLGWGLATGQSIDEVLLELGAVAEGVPTTEAVCELSKRLGIELPIAEQVKDTLKGNTTPKRAIMTLMARPLASEGSQGKLNWIGEHRLLTQRVLMLSWEYPPRIIGGLARVVAELSKQMSRVGWEVHVVTADHPGTVEHEFVEGVHVHRVKTQTDPTPDFLTWVHRLNFGLLQYAIALHRKTPFSIVHAHDWMVGDAGWVMKVGLGVPLVATMHATESGRMHGIHTDLQRYIHQMEWRLTFEAWEIIVNSHHMHTELRNLFNLPVDKIVIIPNGTDPDSFDFKFNRELLRNQYAHPLEKIVLYVGRMVREKGVQVLLDAAPKILTAYPNTRFLLVGTGYYTDDLKRQSFELGLSDRVSFLGYVSDHDLLRIYRIADIVCIPSLYEPFGIVALEGMAARVPVVTSDAGGLTDFVELMTTGITTYSGDSGSLAWGILEILRNPELAEKLAQDAYEKVCNIYNWKVIARRTLEVYEKVLREAESIGPDAVASTPPKPILKASPTLPFPHSIDAGTGV